MYLLYFLASLQLATPTQTNADTTLKVGDVFQDCAECPEMVVIPAGDFMMGSHINLPNRTHELPLHKVTIPKSFAVGKYEVTFEQWDQCVADSACYRPNHFRPGAENEQGWKRGKHPVLQVSWFHIQRYLTWLSKKTGEKYRLLTEAEWEYMARAGTTTVYSTGDTITADQANFKGRNAPSSTSRHTKIFQTLPVGSFAPNGFGVYDVHGSVAEWTQDCWHENYIGAPFDGKAWKEGETCERYVLRGGSWGNRYRNLRSSGRTGYKPDRYSVSFGFRLARDLGK